VNGSCVTRPDGGYDVVDADFGRTDNSPVD